MKVGYPDTINNKAYKQVSPLKARYASSGEGEDLEAVELKSGSLAKKAGRLRVPLINLKILRSEIEANS